MKRFFLIILLLLIVLIVYFKTKREEPFPPSVEIFPPPEFVAKLYFCNKDGLVAKECKLKKEDTLIEQMESVVNALMKNPEIEGLFSPFPPQTKVNALYIVKNIAVVDLSFAKRNEGSSHELLSIYSLVNTLTSNFAQIKKVKILLDGDEASTLYGHIDIRFPLSPRADLVKNADF